MTTFCIWIGIASLLFILEIVFSSSFALLCFSAGSIVAAVIGLLGLNEIWQILGFVVCSLLAFIFIRPVLMKTLNKRSKSRPKTNAEALIGRVAKVVEPIQNAHFPGRVIVDGDNWQAVSSDNQPIHIGENVTVESIDSIVLTVKRTGGTPTGQTIENNH